MNGEPGPSLQHYEGDAWNYPVRPDPTSIHEHGVVDGDTFDVWMRVSPHSIETTRVRFLHISTSEIRFVRHDSEEYRKGMEHYRFVLNWFEDALERASIENAEWPLFARTSWSVGMRGRFLADIFDFKHRSLAEDLYAEFGDEVISPEEWHERTPDMFGLGPVPRSASGRAPEATLEGDLDRSATYGDYAVDVDVADDDDETDAK